MSDEMKNNEEQEAVNSVVNEESEQVTGAEEITAEEVQETVPDTADGATEEAPEEMSDVDKAVAAAMAERDAQDAQKKAAHNKKIKIISTVAAAVVVVGGVVASGFASTGSEGGLKFNTYDGWLPKALNKYNHMGFVNVTDQTVGDLLNQIGVDLPTFLENYGLPADMSKSTYEMVAMYLMPTKNYAENVCGVDFETLKEALKIPDKTEDGTEITEDLEWYIVEAEISVGNYIGGEDNLENFKSNYELGDDVTVDTKWKEIRTAVDSYTKQKNEESKKATEDTSSADEDAADDTATADEAEATAAADATAAPEATASSAE